MEEFGRLERSEKTIAFLGHRWWPQTAKQDGERISKHFYVVHGRSVMSAQTLEVSLLGVGTVLRLERDACSMVKLLRQKKMRPYRRLDRHPNLHAKMLIVFG